ncbi:presequence protease 2 [Tanacetum coccineum]
MISLQPQFSIGLKGVSEENIQKVEALVMNTLENLAKEGFNMEAVEASMNTIEFSLRENNTGSFPRGLALMLRAVNVKEVWTEEDLAELARMTHELKLKQETPDPPEALKTVPSLSLQDIPKKPIQIPIEVGDN